LLIHRNLTLRETSTNIEEVFGLAALCPITNMRKNIVLYLLNSLSFIFTLIFKEKNVMKKAVLVIVVLLCSMEGLAQAQDDKLGVTVDLTYLSKWMSKGTCHSFERIKYPFIYQSES
jgi:hypothetical protein